MNEESENIAGEGSFGLNNSQTPGTNAAPAGTGESDEDNVAVPGESNDDRLTDPDDLHEIKAADDLDEPDPEGSYSPTEAVVQPGEIDPGPEISKDFI